MEKRNKVPELDFNNIEIPLESCFVFNEIFEANMASILANWGVTRIFFSIILEQICDLCLQKTVGW